MMGLPLAFTYAPVLFALIALPAIWWLMRVFPPRPRTEVLPTTRLLLEIARKEEEPARTPWWLLLLRLVLAALVIFALAGPVYRPSAETAPGAGPLLIAIDNGWAAAPRWTSIIETAHRINRIAEQEGRPVALVATADGGTQPLDPADAATVAKRIDALQPRPHAADYATLLPALTAAQKAHPFGGVAWLSDGLGGDGVSAFAAFLTLQVGAPTVVYADQSSELMALKPPIGAADALTVPVIRRDGTHPAAGFVRATDLKGRTIGDAPFDFAAGSTAAEAKFALPVELRNDIARLDIVGSQTAGAVQLLDERYRRRKIGLLSGAGVDVAQPLLSPLYYISRAVQPFADVIEPRDANADIAIPQLIEGGTSIIAMADIGTLTPDVAETLANWVLKGGTLVRFAGPRLAAATDELVPVRLRHGDRVLGGSLTWQDPQPLASFSPASPFAGLAVPGDVLIKRQVLAEPDATLSEHTWASLADGTPLVTAAPSGKGWLVLFHVTADTSWSNLPLSGTFVEMLRRVIAFSSAGAARQAKPGDTVALLPPLRLLDGFGHFASPASDAKSIPAEGAIAVDAAHPPGLYGADDGFRSLNLMDDKATLSPFDATVAGDATVLAYPTEAPLPLRPWLFAGALALFLVDALAVLVLNGGVAFLRRRHATAAVALLAVIALASLLDHARADDAADQFALKAVEQTRLAYVVTGNAEIDAASDAGLRGLSEVLTERTALEPGDPMGVDPAKDDLSFFPLLYWPIDPSAPLPTSATMARVDAYMRQGGSVLFDTRDQLERSTNAGNFSGTPAAEYLRQMLSSLDIPPLEPVPADHVLTKAFYLLNEFPGRYTGGPLWVETTQNDAAHADRPANAGDGVSTILITENDFASAWAMDRDGRFIYPTVPTDPVQREMAFRTGVNIVMYTLTGNYKADQVHVPALLERLGQ
ncbi:MAG: DUF4159 domain-containing protein [Rhizobiales bacterium]|nr:DUF4159 domain-containing protein [Hyphomicrobiales bacterium]